MRALSSIVVNIEGFDEAQRPSTVHQSESEVSTTTASLLEWVIFRGVIRRRGRLDMGKVNEYTVNSVVKDSFEVG